MVHASPSQCSWPDMQYHIIRPWLAMVFHPCGLGMRRHASQYNQAQKLGCAFVFMQDFILIGPQQGYLWGHSDPCKLFHTKMCKMACITSTSSCKWHFCMPLLIHKRGHAVACKSAAVRTSLWFSWRWTRFPGWWILAFVNDERPA